MTENIFDILKYGENRPIYYRKMIDVYFNELKHYVSDWADVIDSKHHDHMYCYTHYVQIDCYFNLTEQMTVVVLALRDSQHCDLVVDNDYNIDLKTKIYTNQVKDGVFLEVFDEIYKDMFDCCVALEYKLEAYPEYMKVRKYD